MTRLLYSEDFPAGEHTILQSPPSIPSTWSSRGIHRLGLDFTQGKGRALKKAEHRRIDAFELWCWRTLLRVQTARRSNQSILKQISPEYSLEGLRLKLKLQYFGHLMGRADSFEKTLVLGKIEGRRRRGRQRTRWLDGITDSMDMGMVDSGSW